jgi:hypothetical protein
MRLLRDARLPSEAIASNDERVLDPRRWETLLGGPGELTGFSTATGDDRGGVVTHGLPPLEEVPRHAPVDPPFPVLLTHPLARASAAARDVGIDALRTTRFCREYFALRADTRNPAAVAKRVCGLTPAQVLGFVAQRYPPDAAAETRGVSTSTLRTLSLVSPLRVGQPWRFRLLTRMLSGTAGASSKRMMPRMLRGCLTRLRA